MREGICTECGNWADDITENGMCQTCSDWFVQGKDAEVGYSVVTLEIRVSTPDAEGFIADMREMFRASGDHSFLGATVAPDEYDGS